jgi:hypothetical protein
MTAHLIAAAHNTANNDTRLFDRAMLKLGKEINCARSTVALRGEFVFHSLRHGSVVCRDVRRKATS